MIKHRLIAFLLMMALLFPLSSHADLYSELKKGDRGEAVSALNQRLYDLGYLSSFSKKDDHFGTETETGIKAFEENNQLPQTGIASIEVQEKLYAHRAIEGTFQEERELYDLTPSEMPGMDITLPQTDEAGFLAEGSEPFVYENEEDGQWLYISDSLKVEISRYHQDSNDLEWYEAYISTRKDEKPYSILSKKEGKTFESPQNLVKAHGSVFAITDDFFGYRIRYKQKPGIILRQGKAMSDNTRVQDRSNLQSLEVLALFNDGNLRTYNSDLYSTEDYLQMGVTDTWAFGPVLVQRGIIPRYFYSKDYHSYREPRCAFGMVENGKYAALVVTGRKDGSRGAYFKWMAEKMFQMGCVEAMNLDGGNTVAMMFMGKALNKAPKAKQENVRKVSSVIAFGTDTSLK